MDCIRNLFLHSLLPQSVLKVEDFVHGTFIIPKIPSQIPNPKKESNTSATRRDGLLWTLTQFLPIASVSGDDGINEPTEKEVRAGIRAKECITVCKVMELFSESR